MKKEIIISKSGIQNGYGTARYKWVSNLQTDELEHLKNDTAIIIITDSNPSYDGIKGLETCRMVLKDGKRLRPRMIRDEELGKRVLKMLKEIK